MYRSYNFLNNFSFFPYYLIVNNKMLLFDSKFNNVTICNDMQKIAVYQQKFTDLYEISKNIVKRFTNAVDLMRNTAILSLQTPKLSITEHFYTAPLLDFEILNNNANPMLPNKEQLVQAVINHYNNFSDFQCFLTTKGITAFCKNGIIKEIPQSYLNPLNIHDRIKLLEKLLKNIKDADIYKTALINSAKLNYCSYDIQIEKNGTIAIYGTNCTKNENSFTGEWIIEIDDKAAVYDFKNVFEFIQNNGYIHTKNYTINFIENHIKELSIIDPPKN